MKPASSYQSYYLFFKTYILPHLPTDKRTKILDIGCGAGYLLYALCEEGYTNYFGINLSQKQIDEARKKVDCVELADAFQYFSRHKNKFNLITLFDVAEHFNRNNLLRLLRKIQSSLWPSGILIIHTLNG